MPGKTSGPAGCPSGESCGPCDTSGMPAPILLSCHEISKAFGSRPLFEGLTFAVHEGDHIGLVGPNGAGKSTLLKILAGVETPDQGTYTRRKNLRIGYVPQHPTIAPGTTA